MIDLHSSYRKSVRCSRWKGFWKWHINVLLELKLTLFASMLCDMIMSIEGLKGRLESMKYIPSGLPRMHVVLTMSQTCTHFEFDFNWPVNRSILPRDGV